MSTPIPFAVGSRVAFRPGPRSKEDAVGTVIEVIAPTLSGKGASVFLRVQCDDGKTRKVRPGACRAA